jgi:hypothetical protein
MGCLNSEGQFSHWFGNIHLSGPCNAACYFCIGQHMMQLDPYNNLNKFPLDGLEEFVKQCLIHGVRDINLTGTNTDPLLYRHPTQLKDYLLERIPGLVLGCRTNGIAARSHWERWRIFDKASISIPSFNPDIYKQIMGVPLDIRIQDFAPIERIKINVVLCPETCPKPHENSFQARYADIFTTVEYLSIFPIRVNLREPYGQPHIGDPLKGVYVRVQDVLGNPTYLVGKALVTYWDVHYTEVESVNLYASGRVSLTYPITKGCADDGTVLGQENFITSGRIREQWLSTKK